MVEYAISTHDSSVKRACGLANISRSAYHYTPTLCDDSEIENALNQLAEKHRRYGFSKMFHTLRLQGRLWNHKRVYRVYCDLRLNLRSKPKKRLARREKRVLKQPESLNVCWSMDFMSDALMNGKRFRTVNLIDDCNREALGIKASISLPAIRVAEFLDDVAVSRGYPSYLRLDNGPENISKDMVRWAEKHHVTIQYIQPGKPAQNAYIERFNRTYREAVLDMYLFRDIPEVQRITNTWLKHYNEERPHESLGNLTPKGLIEKRLLSTNALY